MQNKADLNLANNEGNTALVLSLINNNLEATRILVAAGADRKIQNAAGRDAFSYVKDDNEKSDALQTAAGILDGIPVTASEYRETYRSTYLAQALSLGREVSQTPEGDASLRRLSWQRLVTLREAAKRGIAATDKELTDAIHSNYSDADGSFNPQRYQDFLQNMIRPMKYTDVQFEQHLREEIVIQKLGYQIGKQAQVSPNEVRKAFETLMDTYTVEYVVLGDSAKATAIYEAATSGLAIGKSFRQVVVDMGLEVSDAAPFIGVSGSSSPDLVVRTLMKAVTDHKQGEVVAPVTVDGGFLVVYLKVRKPADPASYEAYQQEISSAMLNRRAQSLFRDWQAAQLTPERFTDYLESSTNGQPEAVAGPIN